MTRTATLADTDADGGGGIVFNQQLELGNDDGIPALRGDEVRIFATGACSAEMRIAPDVGGSPGTAIATRPFSVTAADEATP